MGPLGAHVLEQGETVPVRTLEHGRRFFRAILDRYEPQEVVCDDTDHLWLMWLVPGYPDYTRICPAGAAHFVVRSNRAMGFAGNDRGFCVVAVGSDSPIPFSYSSALRGVPKTDTERLMKAMRRAINHQCRDFQKSNFQLGLRCPINGEPLHLGNLDIDHTPPFDELVQMFLTEEDLPGEKVELRAIASGDTFLWQITADWIVERWQQFHAANMQLRFVSIAGFSQLKRQRLEQQRRTDAARKVFMGIRTPASYDPKYERSETET